jgi:hypothetical protein
LIYILSNKLDLNQETCFTIESIHLQKAQECKTSQSTIFFQLNLLILLEFYLL